MPRTIDRVTYAPYSPTDYGAKFDGTTDDLAAFQAMHADMPVAGGRVELPRGKTWLSDTWRVSKPFTIVGAGGSGFDATEIFVAPGKCAIGIEGNAISADGNNASGARIDGIDVISRLLTHGTANGTTDGWGIGETWSNGGAFRKGECFVQTSNANPTRFYRAGAAGAFLSSEPTWNQTVGGTTSVNGVTFTTEKFPTVRANSTAYAVGDRVWATNDHRYVYECTVAGTSAGAPPAQMAGGDLAPGVVVNGTFTDGTVTWQTRVVAGVRVEANFVELRNVYAAGFTGCGIHVQGGEGQNAAGNTYADNCTIDNPIVEYCGTGLYIGGSDGNGCVVTKLFTLKIGEYLPTAAAEDTGGVSYHDRSDGGSTFIAGYAQASTGRAILKNGNGRSTFIGNWEELDQTSYFTNGVNIIIGGGINVDPTSNNVLILDPVNSGRGILEKSVDESVFAGLLASNAAHPFWGAAENGNNLSWQYAPSSSLGGPTGWWGFCYGSQGLRLPFAVASTDAGQSIGAGWLTFPHGYFAGRPTVDAYLLFDGTLAAIALKDLRGGARKKGDRFRDDTTIVTLTGDGYRGTPWTASTGVTVFNSTWNIAATMVEPTTNTGPRKGGEKVFRCTTAGTTGGSEPNWATATSVNDTVNDNGVVWTLVGFTPAYEVAQVVEKSRVSTRRVAAQTTTSSASQVIHDGGTVSGYDLALTDGTTTHVRDVITLHKNATTEGGLITIESTWIRNGAAPVQQGANTIVYKLAGTTLDGTTVAHVANGNRIELQGSPESADTLNWRIFRTQTEGSH